MPIEVLIRRFLTWGAALIVVAGLGLVALLFNFHQQADFMSSSVAASLASFVRSAFVVGVVLTVAPLISPFLITSPRTQLPIASEEGDRANLRLARRLGELSESSNECLVCNEDGAVQEA
jgi:hypothetical protein